ncbi:ankyrin repeat-containing protein BDA1-like [Olea europaea var. sylvestris]|uniref:ankyrin repeat-containing protein BDA1-like n=1 Tax=Olea europaea var. sylvestris TaxID=158386 RepID=UPI000C1CF851|nr:ankyrin repeat-containing protein BDA1-like [Olea europaea var. sylvestris]
MSTVQDSDIVTLYREIHNNPHYLEVPNEMPFVESPLHTAASEGRTGLALEILRLKPLLGKKLNLDGLSPLHLALSNGHTNTVRRLVKHNPDLIRVPGREGITLLHYAVENEDIDLLIYFLLICPSSINDMTVRDETVVHIAVRNKNLRAFKVLLGWARKTNNTAVFPWRNEEGNTMMHLAALTNQLQVIKSLIRYVHVNEKNLEGKTALDILNPENVEARKNLIRAGAKKGSSLVDDATSCENYFEVNYDDERIVIPICAYLDYGLSGNMRNAFLVVVVLIATAAFQAALTPRFWISHNGTTPVFPSITSVYNETASTNSTSTNFGKGTPLIAKTSVIMNTITFSLAMGTCTILTNAPLQLLLFPSLALFSVSYAVLAWGIYPGTGGQFIVDALVVLYVLPILTIFPWRIISMKRRIRGDICYGYNLDAVKYLTFRSAFTN